MELELSPLSFFESLLESDKYEIMKKRYIDDYIEEHNGLINPSGDIDYENGIIKEDEYTTFRFSSKFTRNLVLESSKAKENIDKNVIIITSNNISPDEFLKIQLRVINSLLLKTNILYINQPCVKQAITDLNNHIINKYNVSSLLHITDEINVNSFNWDYLDNQENDTQEKISSLYNELVAINIISGTEKDFVNGFMGKPVLEGIRWLPKTKDNKSTAKSTLFSFIDYLIDESFILKLNGKEYNDAIEYVFRDYNGNMLKNIRQSKSSSTASIPEDIQEIIDNL
ncbi:hypothetical protein [Elizabethkingia sp. M8]|uniref:hypothetical protein n=1 Tax=Elizabethkingia sp. M8 TaxID=2796140 RepID=UPI001908EA60|nr:hypothetical protein [Elizabethkingia sp. M8]QQM25331.1 hypothetical protein JCR23_10485 [Elizabethkingia sp. M8]